ncbi:MAG: uracil-DNA glycosylase family protein [Fusobacteriaceae bacterium]
MNVDALWEELIFEVGALGPSGKNGHVLIGCGNRHGDILFVGDDSNLYADEAMIYTQGSSGEFLIKLCEAAGLSAEDYYITTLTKSNLPFKDYFDNDRDSLVELLNMQIALINPKIVVALGQDVASILLGREINLNKEKIDIQNWVGDVKFLATYEPAFVKKIRDTSGKKDKVPVDFWNSLKLLKTFIG